MFTIEELKTTNEKLKDKIKSLQKESKDAKEFKESLEPLPKLKLKERKELKGHLNFIYSVCWCESTGQLLSASQDGNLFIWDTLLNVKKFSITLESPYVMTAAFSKNGSWVASGGLDNLCTLYQIGKGKTNMTRVVLRGHQAFLSCCTFLDNDSKILSTSGDGTAALWDIETGKILTRYSNGHVGSIESTALVKEEKSFLTCGIDSTVKLWDFNVPSHVQVYNGHKSDINSIKMHPNNTAFASVAEDGTCILFDIRTDVKLMRYKKKTKVAPITDCQFSHSGRLLFMSDMLPSLFALDTIKGKHVIYNPLREHEKIRSLSLAPSGCVLASSGMFNNIKLWTT